MTERWTPWRSADGSDRVALELALRPVASLTRVLRLGPSPASDVAFLILSRTDEQPGWAADAMSAAALGNGHLHACVAVRAEELRELPNRHRFPTVGLLLDIGDDRVPFDAFADERVEGVRFSRSFVQGALGTLRLRCVLDAMLGLARQLGLPTLGPTVHGDGTLQIRSLFDYTPLRDSHVRPGASMSVPDFELSR